jgi:hypothetical protein
LRRRAIEALERGSDKIVIARNFASGGIVPQQRLMGRNNARYHSCYIAHPGPGWRVLGHSSGWGYGPSGILGVVLIVVLILALTGRV